MRGASQKALWLADRYSAACWVCVEAARRRRRRRISRRHNSGVRTPISAIPCRYHAVADNWPTGAESIVCRRSWDLITASLSKTLAISSGDNRARMLCLGRWLRGMLNSGAAMKEAARFNQG